MRILPPINTLDAIRREHAGMRDLLETLRYAGTEEPFDMNAVRMLCRVEIPALLARIAERERTND